MKIIILSLILTSHISLSQQWQGEWRSAYGTIKFIEKDIDHNNDKLIFGNYAENGYIIGVSIDGRLHGIFFDSQLGKAGKLSLYSQDDFKSFKGMWQFNDIDNELSWNGTKVNNNLPMNLKGGDRYRSLEGQWKSNFGVLNLIQEGVFIVGKYDDKGKIYAVYNQKNNRVFGLFTNKKRYGLLKFNINEERNKFTGLWAWETNGWSEQKWNAEKIKNQKFRK